MNIITYDDLDFNKVSMPPRSILYNLEPMGLGTPYVESLTSYISRLADCHSLNVTTLVCKTFIPYVKIYHLQQSFKNGSLGSLVKYINGNCPVSLDLVSSLEVLTNRNDLIYLTMNLWSSIFSPTNVIEDYRKWCPICLEEFKKSGSEIYEPLIWCIKDVEICDKHQVSLENRCPNCGKRLQWLYTNLIVGHCQYCLTWLGNKKGDLGNSSNYQLFLLESFKALISNAPKLNSFPTNIKIGLVLKRIMGENDISSIAQFADFLGFTKTTLQHWIGNQRKPSIESMFKIYNNINLSIYDLFVTNATVNINFDFSKKRGRKPLNEIEYVLKDAIKNNYNLGLFRLSQENGFDARTAKKNLSKLSEEINTTYLKRKMEIESEKKKKIKQNLITALEAEPPISFIKFLEDFGVLKNDAKKHYPELSKKLMNRYSSYRKGLTRKRIENTKNEIKTAVLELHGNGIYPGSKNMIKKLPNPHCLLKPEFREVWKREMELLGYK